MSNWCYASDLYNVDFLRRNSVAVEKMIDDIAVIPLSSLVRVGDLIVFVRATEDDIQVVARGTVGNIQNGKLLIEIESKSISKFPQIGDRVAALARLKTPEYTMPEAPPLPDIGFGEPPPYEPGYMQLDFGPYSGDFTSATTNSANEYKVYKFDYYNTRFLWYFDFVWRFGLEYETTGGNIPVKGYDRQYKATTYDETKISLHYRVLPIWKELRPTFKFVSKSTTFKTENDDEFVLSSQTSSMGMGANFHYLFNDNLYKPEGKLGFSFNRIYFDAEIYPLVSVKDTGIKRGESSAGLEYDIKVGATSLFYVGYVPYLSFLRRFSLDISAGMSQSQFSFAGLPVDSSESWQPIPQGASYGESQSYFKVMIGFRMDDFIGKLMKPREK